MPKPFVIGVWELAWLSVVCAAVGVLSTLNGLTVLVNIPFLYEVR